MLYFNNILSSKSFKLLNFLENIYLKEFSFKLSQSGNGYACADVDECREGIDICDKNAKCTNNIGSYSCACNNGYRGNFISCCCCCCCFQIWGMAGNPLKIKIESLNTDFEVQEILGTKESGKLKNHHLCHTLTIFYSRNRSKIQTSKFSRKYLS